MKLTALLAAALAAAAALPAGRRPHVTAGRPMAPMVGSPHSSRSIRLRRRSSTPGPEEPESSAARTAAGPGNAGATVSRRTRQSRLSSSRPPIQAGSTFWETPASSRARTLARRGAGFPSLNESPRSFLVDPSRALTLYASTFSGLRKSTDGGRSWSALPSGFQGPIAIAPSAPNVLYGETNGALYRSVDYGMSWTRMTNFSYSSFGLIEVDPRDPNTVYFTAGGDLYKSTEGGANPREIREREGLSDVRAFEIDPRAPATLYAGTEGDGVFRSQDGGATWSRAGRLPAHAVMIDIEVAPSAGLARLRDRLRARRVQERERRQPLGRSEPRPRRHPDPGARGRPVRPVDRLRGHSHDRRLADARRGRHWSLRGFAGRYVNDVAVAPRRPRVVWAAVGRDLYRSGDRGRTWKRSLVHPGPQLQRRRGRAVESAIRLRRHVRAGPVPLLERRPDLAGARPSSSRYRELDPHLPDRPATVSAVGLAAARDAGRLCGHDDRVRTHARAPRSGFRRAPETGREPDRAPFVLEAGDRSDHDRRRSGPCSRRHDLRRLLDPTVPTRRSARAPTDQVARVPRRLPRDHPRALLRPVRRPASSATKASCRAIAFFAFIIGVFLGIPLVCGIAILRHGLWDLDVVVKKTVQYGLLVAGFIAAVALLAVLLPVVLIGLGGGDVVDVPMIVIGALLAIGFILVRTRAQRWANTDRLRQAVDAVRGPLGVRGARWRDLFDGGRPPADGAAPR